MEENTIELIPDAHLLLSSLRSVGYKVETAISDIIDNCISAHATEIHIDFRWKEDKSYILISDNGIGMTKAELIASMKIGSANPLDIREENDLGRFGMGMKTAAFSIGKKLTVFTKCANEEACACWDLDYIEHQQNGKWNLILGDYSQEETKICSDGILKFKTGTALMIENLDRIIDFDAVIKSKISFYKRIEKVKKHIGMIFHRFIEEDQLQIDVCTELIVAWNPFVLNNSATQELSEEEYCDGDKIALIQPYVLPHKTKFASVEDYENAQGPKGWISQQGIYVYRNRRLLVYGTWFDILKKEPAFNLARIKLDITSVSDYDWKIDIKKSVASPPLYMKDMIERAVSMCTAASSKVYNSRGIYSKNNSSQQLGYVWEQRKNRLGAYAFYVNKKHPLLLNVEKKLDVDGRDNLKAYLALVESYAPFMQSGVVAHLTEKTQDNVDNAEQLTDIHEAKGYIRKFLENGFNKEEVENIILGMPNYRHIKKQLKKIFEEETYD